jgi:hypothetical protein
MLSSFQTFECKPRKTADSLPGLKRIRYFKIEDSCTSSAYVVCLRTLSSIIGFSTIVKTNLNRFLDNVAVKSLTALLLGEGQFHKITWSCIFYRKEHYLSSSILSHCNVFMVTSLCSYACKHSCKNLVYIYVYIYIFIYLFIYMYVLFSTFSCF